MKKWQLVISVVSVVVMLLPAVAQANLLKNPDFEEGSYVNDQSVPSNWQGARSKGDSWYAWKSCGETHGGSKLIAVGGKTDAEWGYYKQNISDIKPGTAYRFTAWIATEVWPDFPSKPTAYLKVEFKDGKGSVIKTEKIAVLTGENSGWNLKILITEPAPFGATNANFICYGQGMGSVLFDDVSIEAQPKGK